MDFYTAIVLLVIVMVVVNGIDMEIRNLSLGDY